MKFVPVYLKFKNLPMKTLALQGGGCLGKGQAVALVELEKQAGKPLSQIFGFIGGTSVGAIIGAPLACGLSARW